MAGLRYVILGTRLVHTALARSIVIAPNGATINFKNDVSQRILAQAILHRDFGLKIELPPDRLCPPAPNRLNYILWLEDVITAVSLAAQPPADPTRVVRVLDVGIGASCDISPPCMSDATYLGVFCDRNRRLFHKICSDERLLCQQDGRGEVKSTREMQFTSMLGKLSSLTHIVQLLRTHEIENYAITELIQGHTRRWVVAWSFDNVRLPDPLARLPQHGLQNIMPARNTLTQPLANAHKVTQVRTALMSVLGTIDGSRVESRTSSGQQENVVDPVVSAAENTWSRAARRKKWAAMQAEEGAILEA